MSLKRPWLVLAIGFIVVFFASSIKNAQQTFFVEMAESFGRSRGEFAIAASVFMLVFGFASPLAGYAADRMGPKRTILLGLVLTGGMFIASALIPAFFVYVVLYGVVGAVGLATMSYVPMGVLVDQSFSGKSKGLVYAILTNGTAIAFAVLSPAFIYSQRWWSWKELYLALGVFFLGPLLGLVKFAFKPEEYGNATPGSARAEVIQESQKDRLMLILKVGSFYVLIFGFFGCGVTMAFIDVHMVAHLMDLGLSSSQISIALGALGIMELLGGLLAGYLCDHYAKSYILAAFYLLRAASLFILVLLPAEIGVFLFAGLFGLSYLGTVVGTSMYALDLFGKGNKGLAFGFIWLGHQLGAFLSTQMGADAFDWFGNYRYTIIGTGLMALCSGLLSLIFLPPYPKQVGQLHDVLQ